VAKKKTNFSENRGGGVGWLCVLYEAISDSSKRVNYQVKIAVTVRKVEVSIN